MALNDLQLNSDDDSMSDGTDELDYSDSFEDSLTMDEYSTFDTSPSFHNTPFFTKTPGRQVTSPFALHRNIHFSPELENTPMHHWQPPITPKTPEIDYESTPKINTMPTPDFSVIESAEFSRRRITRSASNPQMPETPCKRATEKSRLGQVATTATTSNENINPNNNIVSNEDTQHYENRFDSFQPIGKGSFSQVYKARNIETDVWYAIKVSNRPMVNSRQRNKAIRELQTVEKLKHPHVLGYLFAWENVVNKTMHIQMELCEKGSLSGFMSKYLSHHAMNPSVYLPEEHIWIFLTDMILGLQHIHSHHLIHLDLKPANIFIANNDFLKIGDFGQAIREDEEEFTEGDARYLAPEILNPGVVNQKSDIFSLGATILEMTSLIEMPQVGKTWETLRSGNIASLGIIPAHYSNDLKLLIELMMDPDFNKRPAAVTIISHPRIQAVLHSRKSTQLPSYFDAINPYRDTSSIDNNNSTYLSSAFISAQKKNTRDTKRAPLLSQPRNHGRNLLTSFDISD